MVMGSLSAQFFRQRSFLSWNRRRNIGVDIAHFLAYLHEDYGKKFLNLEVSTTNILLDERFTPKFCGFESVLPIDINSKLLSSQDKRTLELALQFEEFRNVEDFGIILLELLMGCSWEDVRYSLPDIHSWIETEGSKLIMGRLLDREVQGELDEEEAMRWVKLALWCFARPPSRKPSINKAILVINGLTELSALPENDSLKDFHRPGKRPHVTPASDREVSELMLSWVAVKNKLLGNTQATHEIHGVPRNTFLDVSAATDGFSEANLLGTGDFGSVYKGVLSDGRDVVVKVPNLMNKQAHESFRAECEVMKEVRHRNIVKFIAAYSEIYFKASVFKFVCNGSLDKHLYPHCEQVYVLRLKELLNIAIDIAHALEYLHHDCHVKVVHCDVKPSNVLLDRDMTAHLTNFRIARILDSRISGDSLRLKGSRGYNAPEYKLTGRVSTLGDVYSYGIFLLEMLTKKRPTDSMFKGDLNLHRWVSSVFPDRMVLVVDKSLLAEEVSKETKECLISLIRMGLVCSRDSAEERPTMRYVSSKLKVIRQDWATGTNSSKKFTRSISDLISTL